MSSDSWCKRERVDGWVLDCKEHRVGPLALASLAVGLCSFHPRYGLASSCDSPSRSKSPAIPCRSESLPTPRSTRCAIRTSALLTRRSAQICVTANQQKSRIFSSPSCCAGTVAHISLHLCPCRAREVRFNDNGHGSLLAVYVLCKNEGDKVCASPLASQGCQPA